MTGHNAFGESLREGFDGVAQMQRSKRRRDLERTLSDLINGVAARAIVERERLAALFSRRGGQSRCNQNLEWRGFGAGQVAALWDGLFGL